MKHALLLATLLLSINSYAALQCDKNAHQLIASYHIVEQHLIQEGTRAANAQQRKESFVLWRFNEEVAQQNLSTGTTDYWYKMPSGQLKPTRIFDSYQRAIEYQPDDVKLESGETAWQAKSQLITQHEFKKLKLIRTQGEGCEREEVYQDENNQAFSLIWLPELKVIKQMSQKQYNTVTTWQLEKLEFDTKLIKKQFEHWMSYQSTDYADIGDSENDPFISKMINQGFIQHSHNKTTEVHEH